MGNPPDAHRVALARIIGAVVLGTLALGAGAFVCWWGLGQERSTADTVGRLLEAHTVASPDDGPLPENEGSELYLSGPVTVSEPLHDEATGLRLEALVLWSRPQTLVPTEERAAGESGSRVIRGMAWQDSQVEGLDASKRYPQEVRVGRFVIPHQQLDFLIDIPPIPCSDRRLRTPVLQQRAMECAADGWFYWPLTPGETSVGDIRFGIAAVASDHLSLFARQIGGALAPIEAGNGDYLLLIQPGKVAGADLLAEVTDFEGGQLTLTLSFGVAIGLVGFALLVSAWRRYSALRS